MNEHFVLLRDYKSYLQTSQQIFNTWKGKGDTVSELQTLLKAREKTGNIDIYMKKVTPVQVTHIYFSEPSFFKQCSPKYQRSEYDENWVLLLLGLDWSKHFLPEVSAENLL